MTEQTVDNCVLEELAEYNATQWDLIPGYLQYQFESKHWLFLALNGVVPKTNLNKGFIIKGEEHQKECDCKECKQRKLQKINKIVHKMMNEETGCPDCNCKLDCDNMTGCDDCCKECDTCWKTAETQVKLKYKEYHKIEIIVRRYIGTSKKMRGRIRSISAGHFPYCPCANCKKRERSKYKYWCQKAKENGIRV